MLFKDREGTDPHGARWENVQCWGEVPGEEEFHETDRRHWSSSYRDHRGAGHPHLHRCHGAGRRGGRWRGSFGGHGWDGRTGTGGQALSILVFLLQAGPTILLVSIDA